MSGEAIQADDDHVGVLVGRDQTAGQGEEQQQTAHRYHATVIPCAPSSAPSFCPRWLAAQQQEVRTATLANGMKVIVQEDHNIPNVAMYFFYKIGGRNERPGTTGLSHFFEHMMFNGAKKYGPKMFDKTMDDNGGNNNAYTSNDVTVYTDWFPSSALEVMFDMEADRIRDLAFDPKIIESERGVVYSERRSSVDNNNAGMLRELAWATAFVAHPYQAPVVGWPSDIESWSMEDLKAHFKMGYAPNNCTMVLVGDVKFDTAMTLAKKRLEPIPRAGAATAGTDKRAGTDGRAAGHAQQAGAAADATGLVSRAAEEPRRRPALQVLQTLLTQGKARACTSGWWTATSWC